MLLEREPQLAALRRVRRGGAPRRGPSGAGLRRGRGRQVHAGRGVRAAAADAALVPGVPATACSPRGRSGRCSTSPDEVGGQLPSGCRTRLRATSCSAPAAPAPARRPGRVGAGCRGRALGRRGDARPAALPRPPDPHGLPALLLVTYRDDALAPGDPLRVRSATCATQRSTRRVDVPPLSAPAGRRARRGQPDSTPDESDRLTGGNPFFVTEVLRDAASRLAGLGARRGAGPASRARSAGPPGARRRGPARHPGRPRAAGRGRRSGPPDALDELRRHRACWSRDGAGLRFRHEIARRRWRPALPPHRSARAAPPILDALLGRAAATTTPGSRTTPRAPRRGCACAVTPRSPRRRAAALGAHREAAAQYERALRWFAGARPTIARRAARRARRRVRVLDRWEDSAEARQARARAVASRSATGCGRATRCASCRRRTGGCAAGRGEWTLPERP